VDAVEEWIATAARSYTPCEVFADYFQAQGMEQRLRRRGIRAEIVHPSQALVGRLGALLHTLIRNHTIALPRDEALIDELASVRLRETPGGFRLDHDAGKHDDQAFAIALAAERLLSRPLGQVRTVRSPLR
jgi:hypothetical protein